MFPQKFSAATTAILFPPEPPLAVFVDPPLEQAASPSAAAISIAAAGLEMNAVLITATLSESGSHYKLIDSGSHSFSNPVR
jgi:hypothetical protein